ncbi:CYTH domain-containing protein [Neisseria bergeri]|uniref:CYTH domain-containing protein n=1 Tax=Neisseria bergeri TaxID=1906581 RepID=UPI0027DF3C46|nr:CYTH domain-containing protein [Neisseria bergeri]
MTVEIERRFLIENNKWHQYADEPLLLRQGYLSVEKERTVRVRIAGKRAWLTLKGYISELSRSEFEYEIPLADAEKMMETMCPFKMEKRRYPVRWNGSLFEVDVFLGENAPLVVAEIELPAENADFDRPDWLGREITADGMFTNAYLSKHPFSSWKNAV